jgi:hypothetical protein
LRNRGGSFDPGAIELAIVFAGVERILAGNASRLPGL